MIASLALAAATALPQPGALKTFDDWTVGCENGRACKAVALVPESETRETYLMLTIDRRAAANAKAELRWQAPEGPARAASLKIGGRIVARTSAAALTIDHALARALIAGTIAEVTTYAGDKIGTASLSGLAAALRYIDDKQKRVGTVTALVAKGPSRTVPAPPPLPVIVMPPVGQIPPRTLSIARVTQLIGPELSQCDYAIGKPVPEAYRLDARTSLVTVMHPCGNGAYNIYSSAFLVDEAGKVRAATYDTDKPKPVEGDSFGLVNAGYDPEARRLRSFFKARGVGDCGSSASYAWDGKRFRLTERSDMGECRGSLDYITTWRAVVR